MKGSLFREPNYITKNTIEAVVRRFLFPNKNSNISNSYFGFACIRTQWIPAGDSEEQVENKTITRCDQTLLILKISHILDII